MERRKKLLYIGNKLRKNPKATVTTLDTLEQHFQSEGFRVVSASTVDNKYLRMMDMMLTVLRHARSTDTVLIDTYSTQNFYYALLIGSLCRRLKLPYIPILHGGNLPQRLKNSPSLARAYFKGAKINVAPSNYLMEAFQKADIQNMVYIPNSVPIEDCPFLERTTVNPKLLWVRSFANIYNPMLGLSVFEQLQQHYPMAELCMVGPEKDGSLEQCKAYVKERNLRVKFTGKLSKEAWIELSKDYDVFINTTNFDNTPVSIMEAMALGLPIVSTNVGGIPFLLEDNMDALLVPPNNASAMVTAIVLLCENPLLANKLSKQARKKVEKFDWKIVREPWLKLLQD
jgi:L-malate glycosyltransferase